MQIQANDSKSTWSRRVVHSRYLQPVVLQSQENQIQNLLLLITMLYQYFWCTLILLCWSDDQWGMGQGCVWWCVSLILKSWWWCICCSCLLCPAVVAVDCRDVEVVKSPHMLVVWFFIMMLYDFACCNKSTRHTKNIILVPYADPQWILLLGWFFQ